MEATNAGRLTEKDVSTRTTDNIEAASEALSLEEKSEKEAIEHPNEITQDAQLGVQKAEATALVWSKTALYATYAW
jgi:hypothetical protein